ncbi:hypothetical protein, partial [Mesorhizobium sp.]|uniref:hypothetical protein n=1 Tax=Mesorhizobium sp. TaxID=1871066 RepID=UPI0025E5A25F
AETDRKGQSRNGYRCLGGRIGIGNHQEAETERQRERSKTTIHATNKGRDLARAALQIVDGPQRFHQSGKPIPPGPISDVTISRRLQGLSERVRLEQVRLTLPERERLAQVRSALPERARLALRP